jgi:hypothetical protein
MTATAFLDGGDPLFEPGTRVFDIDGKTGVVVQTESIYDVRMVLLRDELDGDTWWARERDVMKVF